MSQVRLYSITSSAPASSEGVIMNPSASAGDVPGSRAIFLRRLVHSQPRHVEDFHNRVGEMHLETTTVELDLMIPRAPDGTFSIDIASAGSIKPGAP